MQWFFRGQELPSSRPTSVDWFDQSIDPSIIYSFISWIYRSINFLWQTEIMNFFQAVTCLLLGSAHAFAPAQVCSHKIIDNTIGDMLGPLWWTRNLWISIAHQLFFRLLSLDPIPSNIFPSSFKLFPLSSTISFISHHFLQFTFFITPTQPEQFTISPLKHHSTHPIYLHYSITGNTLLHLAAIYSSIHL